MNKEEKLEKLINHYQHFFAGHGMSVWKWELGPITRIAPWFKVLRFEPGPKTGLWTYASVGTSLIWNTDMKRFEFVIQTEKPNPKAIELLTMVAHYHSKENLGCFHTLPVGEPWLEGATCDHLMVSLPYPFGEELEIYNVEGEDFRILWLLPITKAEKDFMKVNGVDALEEKFDQAAIEYWRLDRSSVV